MRGSRWIDIHRYLLIIRYEKFESIERKKKRKRMFNTWTNRIVIFIDWFCIACLTSWTVSTEILCITNTSTISGSFSITLCTQNKALFNTTMKIFFLHHNDHYRNKHDHYHRIDNDDNFCQMFLLDNILSLCQYKTIDRTDRELMVNFSDTNLQ